MVHKIKAYLILLGVLVSEEFHFWLSHGSPWVPSYLKLPYSQTANFVFSVLVVILGFNALRKFTPEIFRRKFRFKASFLGFLGWKRFFMLLCFFAAMTLVNHRFGIFYNDHFFPEAKILRVDADPPSEKVIGDEDQIDPEAAQRIAMAQKFIRTGFEALSEELVYRYFLLGVLLLLLPEWAGILLAGFFFGVGHVTPDIGLQPVLAFNFFFQALFGGFMFGVIYTHYGLLGSWAFHFVYNYLDALSDAVPGYGFLWMKARIILVFFVMPAFLFLHVGGSMLTKRFQKSTKPGG